MNSPDYGVIVGRFQVPELHVGHLELFRVVRGFHNRVIVFLGVSAGLPTRKNPLDFETRRLMIQSKFPEFTVLPLKDKRTDEEWSNDLDTAIHTVAPWGNITLYGARDSFVPKYCGKHKPKELALPVPPMSGTTIRDEITNVVEDSRAFRAGVIHAVNIRPPQVYTTVDVAILHERDGIVYVALAEKPGLTDYKRFVGGFAEPNRDTFEADCKREVLEETQLSVDSLKYLGSATIQDWRYEGSPDVIKTLFFTAHSMVMAGRASDDISDLGWRKADAILPEIMVPEHRPLLAILQKHLKENHAQSSVANG